MPRKIPPLTPKQEAAILTAYGETGSMSRVAAMTGISYHAVKAHVDANREEFQAHRDKKAVDIIPTMAMVRRLALEELMSPTRLARATTHELTILMGVLTDKINVILGQPTSRIAVQRLSNEVLDRFTPEEREKIRQYREKLIDDGRPREVVDGVARHVK